jgi:hypothetical protein
VQIKHTSQDRELSKDSFSADGRSLRLDLLFDALLSDLDLHPERPTGSWCEMATMMTASPRYSKQAR